MTAKSRGITLVIIVIMLLIIISVITYYYIKMNRLTKSKAMQSDKNVIAFLKMIRIGEGTSGANGYKTLFGGTTFHDFSKHPNIRITAGGYTSTAAGAYQFLFRTWNELANKYNIKDFTPASQDLGAIIKLDERGALDLIKAGKFDEAVKKTNREWASLPGSPYGQPTVSLDMIRRKYIEYGGQIA
jgi:muramidase (phage lysozyme)